MRKPAPLEAPERAMAKRTVSPVIGLIFAFVSGAASAGQIDSATFFMLRAGMSESEILIRAGSPDLVTTPGGERIEVLSGDVVPGKSGITGFDVSRRVNVSNITLWHYIPDRSEHDPHLTIITMKGGQVFSIEREKVFSRHGLPEPPAAAPSRRPSDTEIVRERLERTMSAAEHYARTRARLKQEGIDLKQLAAGLPEPRQADAEARVYRGIDSDGGVYYGDRPPWTPDSVSE